ncbi:MAG TPA: hypothetical protein VJI32_07375 [Candidatus Nanoarchaeia archaeon]|nr:hypothetical protein [Candidatus Nanoarchaeia archaeon]
MMEKNRFAVLLGVFILSLAFLSFADTDTGWPCADNLACEEDLGTEYYCGQATGTCFFTEVSGNTSVSAPLPVVITTTTTPVDQRIAVLEASLTTVRNDLAAINLDTRDIGTLRTDINGLQRQIAQISNDISQLSQEVTMLNTELSPQVNQALAGFAALQEDLNVTQTELNQVEQGLAKERAFTKFLTYTFFVLLAIAVALGVMYYLLRSRTLDQEIVDFITKHIKRGTKYPEIKRELLKAGWSEDDISWAYKETMKQNYQSYLQRKPSPASSSLTSKTEITESRSSPTVGMDKHKMISIVAVSIFLLIGIFFLLSGTVGKAVFVERFINSSSGEIIDVVSCTPPQILTPDKDACCTDTNNNTQCDTAERDVVLSVGACADNLQCGSGKLCINGACGSLQDLYHGSEICDKQCNYYALRVLTSDGETYNVKPKRGSYTAAGAVEWKIMEAPQHCNGEPTVIPVSIIRKVPGKILSEEVITLHEGEASATITHPALPDFSFSLKIENVNELCS